MVLIPGRDVGGSIRIGTLIVGKFARLAGTAKYQSNSFMPARALKTSQIPNVPYEPVTKRNI